jgi:Replication initiation factor
MASCEADPGTVQSAGVDWITCTQKRGNDLYPEFHHRAVELLEASAATGHSVRDGAMEGYKTRYTAGGVLWGTREDDALVRLSGDAAREHWRGIFDLAGNVSRLDLQVTVEFPQPDTGVLATAFRELGEAPPRRGRPLKYSATVQKPTGLTLYIGSRRSDWFGRIYDKSAEQGDDANAGRRWRYEVELKRHPAMRTALELTHRKDTGRFARALVHGEISKRGITPRFTSRGHVPVDRSREPTDNERRLRYLATVVGPMLGNLVDGGLGNLAAHAMDFRLPVERRLDAITAHFTNLANTGRQTRKAG